MGSPVTATIFTTVKTPSQYIALPRLLSLQKRKGSGRIFLDSTHTVFRQEWQKQAQTVFAFTSSLFSTEHYDFLISVNCEDLDGWSTSIPLFLLFASSITGESLPKNIFAAGCMFLPDGFISYENFKGVQAKIDALEHVISYSPIETPRFLVPFSIHQYRSERVVCIQVASMFSALEIALPETFQTCTSQIKKLSHVKSQDALQHVLHIPETGDAFVVVAADQQSNLPAYAQSDSGTLIMVGNVPADHPVYLYFIRESQVMFKHFYSNAQEAFKAISRYEEVFHEEH